MNSENQTPRSYFKTVFSLADDMKALRKRKNPALAATLGFFTGRVGLGYYMGTWPDFFIPFFILLLIVIFSGGTLLEIVPFFWAAWGWRRAVTSNAKLDAGGSTERILEAEVITESPPNRPTKRRFTRLRFAVCHFCLFRGGFWL
jgi:hypothetical protein